jgi:hypothetical protein
MHARDLEVRIRYFREASAEQLELPGVDRTRMHTLEAWRTSFTRELARPVGQHGEPHAFNIAPNRALQGAGFRFVSAQWTTPGPMNVEQVTNLWVHPRGPEQPARSRGDGEGTDGS